MKTKLLFIIWSNSYGGGAERQLTNLVNNLDKEKYEIDVIEYFHTNINPEKLNSNINVLKPINNKITESKIKRFMVNILMYICPMLIRKIYIKKKYDVEISFNYLIPSFLLSRNKNVKTVSWIHGAIWDISKDKNWLLNKLQRRTLKSVDKIVCIASDTKKSVDTLYPEFKEKTEVIYNGYDFDNMINLSNEEKKEKKKDILQILYCNRLDDNKNPLLLIEAAKHLKEKTNNFHINILGKGELEGEIKKLILDYDLSDNVSLLGYIKNPYPYYKSTDVVVLTSKTEGFSNVIIEGLCFSKPFVSTDVGIVREIRNENVGIVANNEIEMAQAFLKIIDDANQYKKMVENCDKISKRFSLKNQVKNFDRVVNKILNNSR